MSAAHGASPSPALARIKRHVRRAVELCGGVDGAAATAERGRSVAGDWANLNHRAFPPIDCALALDEVAIALGGVPPILSALAAELGCVAIRLPEAVHGECALANAMIAASAEFGDVAHEVRDATRDGAVTAAERARITDAIDEAMTALVELRAMVWREGEQA